MDTIAAIATSPGMGGIGIIRISGDKSFEIILKILKSKKIKKFEDIVPNTINYGYIVDGEKIIDEVLVSFFREPHSYTTENVVEINTHGGIVVMKQILEVVLKNGARIAENGEFTKRAFINGRIDLTKVEAISSILNAKSEIETSISQTMLKGKLKDIIDEIKDRILKILMKMEVSIDYPEYEVEEIDSSNIIEELNNTKIKLEKFEKNFEIGRKISEGITVSLIGKPNVGKSSLLNIMLNKERAIVTEIEGTTRDTIEESILINGFLVKIIDTAGIRNTDEKIEKIGIEKTIEAAKKSDIILFLVDLEKTEQDIDFENLDYIINYKTNIKNYNDNKKRIVFLLNKIDSDKVKNNILNKENIYKKINEYIDKNKENIKSYLFEISCLNKIGIDQIYDCIRENIKELQESTDTTDYIIIHQRQKEILNSALEKTREAIEDSKLEIPIDILSTKIKEIVDVLNELTGENVSDELLKEIFSNFCLGK